MNGMRDRFTKKKKKNHFIKEKKRKEDTSRHPILFCIYKARYLYR